MSPRARSAVVALTLAVLCGSCAKDDGATFIVDRIEHTEDEIGAGGWVVLEGPTPDSSGLYPHFDVPAALLPLAQAGDSLRLSAPWVEEWSK